MLRLRFLNVAEGDSILIEDIEDTQVFRLLVDTGRDIVSSAAPCASCAEHLRAFGVDRLDQVLITHLHIDHVGGLMNVLENVRVGTILCGFVPLSPGRHFDPSPKSEKQVRGLAQCLNLWSDCVRFARDRGIGTRELFASWTGVRLTPRLTADFILPDITTARIQREVYNAVLDGQKLPEEKIVRASRMRNPNSLRARLYYAGRQIELSGDCYGTVWEHDDFAPCDILKVPHHGDAKSVTKTLARKLRPKHSVICCAKDYVPAKDRPSMEAARLLRQTGSKVWYTDAYQEGDLPPRSVPSTDFTITEEGRILPPR